MAPFPGAETGTGGRLRDVQATGRGAHTLAGVCGYCVGSLLMPEYPLPWEGSAANEPYSRTLALPVDILVEASNGASDYGALQRPTRKLDVILCLCPVMYGVLWCNVVWWCGR